MRHRTHIPKFVSVVAIALGCIDLIRGFMQPIALDFAASNIAGCDLSSSLAGDWLQQMGALGISNYLTGIMLILIGWKARPLELAMLGNIPVAHMIGMVGIKVYSAPNSPSQADWGGAKPMKVYLVGCGFAFVAGIIMTAVRRNEALPANNLWDFRLPP